jgi:hypothetical protein
MLFDHIVEKHPSLYRPWVATAEHYEDKTEHNTDWRLKAVRYIECKTNNFAFKCTRLLRESVIFKEEPFGALSEIISTCLRARDIPFLLANQTEPVGLDMYEQRQVQQMVKVSQTLHIKGWA